MEATLAERTLLHNLARGGDAEKLADIRAHVAAEVAAAIEAKRLHCLSVFNRGWADEPRLPIDDPSRKSF